MEEQLQAEIQRVLQYYHDEVIPALAAALTIDDVFPEEVLNEIRNAMTHVSRASCMTDAAPENRANEAKASQRHLKRVVLDCLKVCILALATRSETAVKALQTDVKLPLATYTRMSDLRRRRKELSAHEGQYTPDQVIEDMKVLFNDYDLFYRDLDKEFAGDTVEMRTRGRFWRGVRAHALTLVIGIAASLAAAYVYAGVTGSG